MGNFRSGAAIDSWLSEGGLVVAASDRAARALQADFHRRRRHEGNSAWSAPDILDWKSLANSAWEARSSDDRLLLNKAQELAVWTDLLTGGEHLATQIETSRRRIAAMAMHAHELLCAYAPRFLADATRIGWDLDAGIFSRWLAAFNEQCRYGRFVSASRTVLEVTSLLRSEPTQRPSLLLVGFDRIAPQQQEFFDAWGASQQLPLTDAATDVHFHTALDEATEMEACARWCATRLGSDPTQRILVVTQSIAQQRGSIERAFLEHCTGAGGPLFEFTLGIPLSQVPLTRAAHLLLRWLGGALLENEVDWLISTGHISASGGETLALQLHMRTLRRRGLAQPDWTLEAFIQQGAGHRTLPASWVERFSTARTRLAEFRSKPQSPIDWAGIVPTLLSDVVWPGTLPLTSPQYQAWQRWEQVLNTCASLGFNGSRTTWQQFLSSLEDTLSETLFAPESVQASIQIAGPAESAGLEADAIWFMGVDDDAWPANGSTHPLLPFPLQRESRMPHSTRLDDWEIARAASLRLLSSAPSVHFSFATHHTDSEGRPSRLISQLVGVPEPLPSTSLSMRTADPTAIVFEDLTSVPFPPNSALGGSSVLTFQSQCPFKSFAVSRMGAQGWEPAEAGLSASQRGQLLHAVLHSIWSGPPPSGVRSHADLLALTEVEAFVSSHVRAVFRSELPNAIRKRMPRRYLELEESRVIHLVIEWLRYESSRAPFTVEATESSKTITFPGLSLNLRLDRIDRLNDDSLLVIDYKTGDVSPNAWDLPRPEDVQLPLYAAFALGADDHLGGLAFAKIRASKQEFAGRLVDARTTLLPGLSSRRSMVNKVLTDETMSEWKACIAQLARDFINGRAEVDPRDFPKTCERCDLQSVCRIYENQVHFEADDSEADNPDE